jgi:hypothetical protein
MASSSPTCQPVDKLTAVMLYTKPSLASSVFLETVNNLALHFAAAPSADQGALHVP